MSSLAQSLSMVPPLSAAVHCCGDCGTPVARPWARWCDVCRPRHRGKPAKYVPTPVTDEVIRQAYQRFWEFHSWWAIKTCAKRIGWPHWAVKKRAQKLGLSRASENEPWTSNEERILHSNAHHSDRYVAVALRDAGFHRTPTAVHLKMKRERIKQNLDGYSGRQLAEAFGIDNHKITRWITSGALKAERREQDRTPQQGGNAWWIRRDDVRDFVFRCPDEIDLKKVEKFWFLDLVTDGRICR